MWQARCATSVMWALKLKKEVVALLPANQDIFSFDEKSNKIVSFGYWHSVHLVDYLQCFKDYSQVPFACRPVAVCLHCLDSDFILHPGLAKEACRTPQALRT